MLRSDTVASILVNSLPQHLNAHIDATKQRSPRLAERPDLKEYAPRGYQSPPNCSTPTLSIEAKALITVGKPEFYDASNCASPINPTAVGPRRNMNLRIPPATSVCSTVAWSFPRTLRLLQRPTSVCRSHPRMGKTDAESDCPDSLLPNPRGAGFVRHFEDDYFALATDRDLRPTDTRHAKTPRLSGL